MLKLEWGCDVEPLLPLFQMRGLRDMMQTVAWRSELDAKLELLRENVNGKDKSMSIQVVDEFAAEQVMPEPDEAEESEAPEAPAEPEGGEGSESEPVAE